MKGITSTAFILHFIYRADNISDTSPPLCKPLTNMCGADIAVREEDTTRELSVGELLERANRDRSEWNFHIWRVTLKMVHDESLWPQTSCCLCVSDPGPDEPTLIGGDIAIKPGADRNADPCTSRGCLWQKWSDGKVYIPYYIANHYCKLQFTFRDFHQNEKPPRRVWVILWVYEALKAAVHKVTLSL